jgi:hypothetical protein
VRSRSEPNKAPLGSMYFGLDSDFYDAPFLASFLARKDLIAGTRDNEAFVMQTLENWEKLRKEVECVTILLMLKHATFDLGFCNSPALNSTLYVAM